MATNDIHVTVSDNNVSAPLTVSGGTSLRSVNTDSGSPYYVGARAYVTQTENGATITVIDREGTTTATVLNGTNGVDGRDGVDGQDGTDGVDGVGITSITQNLDGTLTILLDDGSSYITEPLKGADGRDGTDGVDGFSPIATVTKSGDTATISITDKNGTTTASVSDGTDGVDGQDGADGADGEDGNGIVSITKTATVGLVDTYTILFTDGTTTTFDVTNGANGSGSVADVWVDGISVLDGDTAKIDLTGKADIDKGIPFGVCSTAKATVQKEVTINGITALEAGVAILVKFVASNTAANPTLKVNTLDAKDIMRYGTTAPSTSAASSWNANSVNLLVYDGTYWQMTDWNNTTYSAMTQSEMEAGTATTGRNITAQRLKQAIEYHESPTPENLSDLNNDMVVSDFTNDAGYITGYTETDPTVPSWAKEASKPSYTASEIGGLIDFFYPVGSYYETSDTTFNPNTAWNGTTWVLEAEGQVHVSSGTNYTVSGANLNSGIGAKDGGDESVTLDTTQIPAHTHGSKTLTGTFRAYQYTSWNSNTTGIVSQASNANNNAAPSSGTNNGGATFTITATHEHSSVGGGQAHNNMQPYIVVNRWHRTA